MEPSLGDRRVHGAHHVFRVPGPRIAALAMARQVKGQDPAAGVDLLQLGECGPPHGAVEAEPVQQDEGRPVIVGAGEVGGQPGEPVCGDLSLCHTPMA